MNDIPVVGGVLPNVLETMANRGDERERWPVVRTGERARISRLVRRVVFLRDRGVCQMCGTRRGPWETDHIVPWSAGGADDATNLRLLCQDCNQSRSNFRAGMIGPMLPVAAACDVCIMRGHIDVKRCRWGRACPVCGDAGPQDGRVTVFCGCCREVSYVSHAGRVL